MLTFFLSHSFIATIFHCCVALLYALFFMQHVTTAVPIVRLKLMSKHIIANTKEQIKPGRRFGFRTYLVIIFETAGGLIYIVT
jgi:hypothetical protein